MLAESRAKTWIFHQTRREMAISKLTANRVGWLPLQISLCYFGQWLVACKSQSYHRRSSIFNINCIVGDKGLSCLKWRDGFSYVFCDRIISLTRSNNSNRSSANPAGFGSQLCLQTEPCSLFCRCWLQINPYRSARRFRLITLPTSDEHPASSFSERFSVTTRGNLQISLTIEISFHY